MSDYADALKEYGIFLFQNDDGTKTQSVLEEALSIYSQLAENSPSVTVFQRKKSAS